MPAYPDLLVEKEFTAVNSDALASTDLDQPPTDGLLHLWLASTVNTANVEVPQPGHGAAVTNSIQKRTDGIPNIVEQPAYVLSVTRGKHPIVSITGTTGTIHLVAAFYARR